MSEEDTVHPVVELLAARMESHPEEFRIYNNSTLAIGGRWETWISQIRPFMNEAEHRLLFNKSKEAFLQRVHEEVLDELLNGEARRAEERRQRKEAEERMMAQVQQSALQPGQFAQVQSLGALQSAGAIRLGSETIDEGMLKQIKRKLGL